MIFFRNNLGTDGISYISIVLEKSKLKNENRVFYLYNGKTVEFEPQEGKKMKVSFRKGKKYSNILLIKK